MTTRRSSSQRSPLNSLATLNDSAGAAWRIGREIGKGGEGRVYEIDGEPSLVAKVYHQTPLNQPHVEKLEALVACWSKDLETISAWPRSLLFDPASHRPCGILTPKISHAHQLHELYGTTNRRRHFPEAAWHHLVLAARNTAAAFYRVNAAGVVVGDVNQGNLLVDKQMCVRLIDCDSVQIAANGKCYACPVGSPHFTPPELQSMRLRDVQRTENHDRFGLAVLIFHLLFVGRHPFAGRYRGPGDMPIEKAIDERRFAFSRDRQATLVDPPPASLSLDDLPRRIADMFEAAFRQEEAATALRPSPEEWVEQLEDLMKQRQACSFNPMHVYYRQLQQCPWCRIEEAGGPSFFVQTGGISIVSDDRYHLFDQRIQRLEEVRFPDFPTNRLAMPRVASLKNLKERPKPGLLDVAAGALAASWPICFVGMFSTVALIAGSALSLGGGAA